MLTRDVSMTNGIQPDLDGDLLWGIAAIARYIGRSQRQTYYLVARGAVPAKKLGARTIAARKSEIDAVLKAQFKDSSTQ